MRGRNETIFNRSIGTSQIDSESAGQRGRSEFKDDVELWALVYRLDALGGDWREVERYHTNGCIEAYHGVLKSCVLNEKRASPRCGLPPPPPPPPRSCQHIPTSPGRTRPGRAHREAG